MKTTKAKNKESGEGHKARIALVARCKVDMDGKVNEFNIDYDATVTIEYIDYIVRQIASGIAQAAGKVARVGVMEKEEPSHRDLRKERQEEFGVSSPIPE